MVGRIAVAALSTLLLAAPHLACADTRKAPKAPAPTAAAKAKAPTPAPTPPPVATAPVAPTPPATTDAMTPVGASTCSDPRTEVACLRRENDELRRKINEMVATERARQERLTKQLGGGTVINALK